MVVPETIKLPPIVTSSPTHKSFAIPTPPATFNAPLVDDVLSVVDDIITSFAAVTFPSLAILTLFTLSIFMFIAVLPSIAISPADVVKLDAAPAFNETPAVEVTPTVVAPFNVVAPAPFIWNVAVPSVNVMAFTDVNVTASASNLTAVDAALPIWMVRAEAPEPILMF